MDHKDILHMSRQLYCRGVYNISLWSVKYILNQNMANFGRNIISGKVAWSAFISDKPCPSSLAQRQEILLWMG